jgi:hypothetical protein
MAGHWQLTDEHWELVESVLRLMRREDNRGCPGRQCLSIKGFVDCHSFAQNAKGWGTRTFMIYRIGKAFNEGGFYEDH